MRFPLVFAVEHLSTRRVWLAEGWRAGVVVLAFVTLLGLLAYLIARVVWLIGGYRG